MSTDKQIYIPKNATQQVEFLQKYPEFDGREVFIAVFDCGVDVSHPGFQQTSTGLPKIIECYDFCETEKVDTSMVKKTESNNCLIGKSGRELKIPSTWKNPSGKWHLGIKDLNMLLPQKIIDELKKNKCLEKTLETELEIEDVQDKPSNAIHDSAETEMDCIVWFDGEKWRACVDTSFSMDLENAKVLTNFGDEHEYSFLTENVSYCISIKDEGNLLQIIVPSDDHGNLVANVLTAHFPGEPEKSGLAPGAQIVSFSVRSRLGISGIKDALLKCIELKVDIIVASLNLRNYENLYELMEKVVEKHGIISVKAAGNWGPIFSQSTKFSINFNQHIYTIGSILDSEMRKKLYEIEDISPPTMFTYSSKGLYKENERKVDFVAPGAAILSTPPWSSNSTKNDIVLGTSFAAPNAAGAIACLISALKSNNIEYSPATIRLALSQTAYFPEGGELLGFGNGIIQISSAFDFFKTKHVPSIPAINLKLFQANKKLTSKKSLPRKSIYLIQDYQNQDFKNFCLKITESNNNKILWDFKIVPETAKDFIEFLKIEKSDDDELIISIKTTSTKPGTMYYGEIRGFDSSNPSLGPLFNLPITLIYAMQAKKKDKYCITETITLKPYSSFNLFFLPKSNSNRCIIKVIFLDEIQDQKFASFQFGSVHKRNEKHFKFTEKQKQRILNFPVIQNELYEIAMYESEAKETPFSINFKLEISFEK